MRNINILLCMMFGGLLVSCDNGNNIKNTTWRGLEKDNTTTISFQDSICNIYKKSNTTADTIKAMYSFNRDTIKFKPIDEYIIISSNLVKKGDKLYSISDNKPIFIISE